MLLGTLVLVLGIAVVPFTGQAQDAKAIMKQVLDRDDGTTEVSLQKLSTCRYAKKGKKLVCAESPRVKVMESVRKDVGPREKDTKSVSLILEPPVERGIGFLQYDYDEDGRDTDQWMYLSAFGKVKRIVSGDDNEPTEGSFFGSEFGYEDLERRQLEEYTYKLLKSETYQKRDTWVIESVPTPARARKSNYSKSILWVDKERLLVLKSILYDRQGKRSKRVTLRKVEQVNDIWVARYISVNNLQTKRMSTLVTERLALNVEVKENFLTQRVLTDGAFREGGLEQMRAYLK